MDNAGIRLTEMGEPDLQLAGLRLWIHGYQFPESKDYWDGNWLIVTAHCSAHCCASGADVWVNGPILHLSELHRWMLDCESMYASLKEEANLDCMEPNFEIKLKKITELGQIDMWVSITPDHVSQEHYFNFEIDQLYLPELIKGLKTIFRSYPIRGSTLE